jgi:hypothetical protein
LSLPACLVAQLGISATASKNYTEAAKKCTTVRNQEVIFGFVFIIMVGTAVIGNQEGNGRDPDRRTGVIFLNLIMQ